MLHTNWIGISSSFCLHIRLYILPKYQSNMDSDKDAVGDGDRQVSNVNEQPLQASLEQTNVGDQHGNEILLPPPPPPAPELTPEEVRL